jgi:hypothetical protein
MANHLSRMAMSDYCREVGSRHLTYSVAPLGEPAESQYRIGSRRMAVPFVLDNHRTAPQFLLTIADHAKESRIDGDRRSIPEPKYADLGASRATLASIRIRKANETFVAEMHRVMPSRTHDLGGRDRHAISSFARAEAPGVCLRPRVRDIPG